MGDQLGGRLNAAIGLGVLFATATPKAAEAQESAREPEHIIVTADRMPDALGGIAPIDRVTTGDIAGYGDDTLGDLLADLNREDKSIAVGAGALILLNGRRISGPQAVSDLPTESIERVDIYPAPAAQRYGGTAGQKVFNFVLRERHRSQTATVSGNFPTAGGGESGNAAFSITKVAGDNRTTFAARGTAARRLLENERGIEADSPSGADQTRFRTLKPDQRRLVLNGVLARQAGERVTVTASAGADIEEFRRLNGLPDGEASLVDPRPLRQKITAGGGYGNLNANAGLGRWELTGTAEFALRETNTSTQLPLEPSIADTLNLDRMMEHAHSNSKTGRLAVEGSGPLVTLPAGDLRLNVSTEFSRGTLNQRVRRFSVEGKRSRNDAGASLDASIPITKAAAETASPLRGLSAQFGAGIRSVSDIGTLHSFSAGINWAPTTVVSLNAAVKADQQPPTLVQVASPRIETSGVPWFDYVTGETVDVAQITGGNPFLQRDRRKTLSVAMNVVPFGPGPLRVSVDYKDVRINDLIAGLPAATAAIQEAFPERFIRDETGTLVEVDTRPLNLVWERRNQLHWGVLMRYPWSRDRAAQDEDKAEQADRLGIRFSLDHTWVFRDRLLLRRDFPSLDLLNDNAKGDSGGQPRHIVQWELSAYKRGLGARLSGRWQSGTRVEEGAMGSSSFLRFSPLVQHDLRLFADLGKRLPQERWAQRLRFSLLVANLLNDHQKVRDTTGATPLRYQRGYVDPYGRTISLELRKQIS